MTARFIRQGVSEFRFSPTIGDVNAVTRAEWDAAQDLTTIIAGVNGWMLGNNDVPTPDFGSDFDGSIPGTNSVDNSSFDFYDDLDDETIETLLPPLTPGFVLIARKGDKPGSNSLDCFPVRVKVKGNNIELGNTPAKFNVAFSITGKPGLDGPVPSAGPVVTAITPNAGAAAGATAITITGSGFTGATGGSLGGVALTAFTVASDTQITATTGAHAAGLVDLVVTHPAGNVTKTGAYTYV